MYRRLRASLPATTVVSIGHRESLQALHDAQWRLEDSGAVRRWR